MCHQLILENRPSLAAADLFDFINNKLLIRNKFSIEGHLDLFQFDPKSNRGHLLNKDNLPTNYYESSSNHSSVIEQKPFFSW